MRLVVQITEDRTELLQALLEEANRTGRGMGELVLEALEKYGKQSIPEAGKNKPV